MKKMRVQDKIRTSSAFLPEDKGTSNSTLEIPASMTRTYQPYPWQLVNHALDFVDEKTSGRAGQIQRVFSYLFFGGLAAVVNLLVLGIMLYLVPFPNSVSGRVHIIAAYVIAAECSIMANFLPNDRFTFSSLPGAKRPWLQRCLRYHATTIVGTLLTFALEFAFASLTNVPKLPAAAISIVIVLIYNFTFHHLFTYRYIRGSEEDSSRASPSGSSVHN